MQHVDVAVIGGGIVGLTLASALQNTACSIAIVNKGAIAVPAGDKPTARVSAINQANIAALKGFGVWDHVQQDRANAYHAMHVWDKDSFGDIHFNSDDVAADSLGVIIENQALVNGLLEQVQGQSNVSFYEQGVDRILSGPNQTMVMFDNGDALSCRLLVGADGANSIVRKHAGFPITFKDYEHTAIVANIRTAQAHGNVARQAFTPTGPLALLPMVDPNVCSIVWSQAPEAANTLLSLSDDDFCNALAVACDMVLGNVTLETTRVSFPLTMRYARQWAKDGIVLAGDAAHTIHPLAGQGANLGMQDAQALAHHLSALISEQKDIGALKNLRAYERERKSEAVKMIAAMDGFKLLFDGNDPLKKMVRGIGLSVTDKIAPVKHAFITHAMGL
ncbi:FAD-dependent monooxygenase [Alteromonas sp. A079]|uniref:FAD-dependent monooxygenase n=1 Tax=Alteromonas sp. A079 TaxID=3410268 RepID=UPI003B9F8469